VAKSKSGEFYTFDEVLRQLNIDENRLKRLVSEGEIRAFREGDQMKFKRAEIDNLAGKGGRGGSSDTSLSEISLEDEPARGPSKKKGAETLTDDLLNEPDLTKRAGMKTAEISSQDTFIDKGGDVGMSTEPIDFTEDVGGDEPEGISAEASGKKARGGPPPVQRRAAPVDEGRTHPGLVAVRVLTAIVGVLAALVSTSLAKEQSNELSRWFAEKFNADAYKKAPVAAELPPK
jgi:excisionase family DNA binding protein